MQICEIIGNVVYTVKNKHLVGKKILIVQPLDLDSNPFGKEFLAVDSVGAGVGERVLTIREGGSARIVFDDKEIPIQAVIVAIIDGLDISKENL